MSSASKKHQEIYAKRKEFGIYHTKETLNESIVCLNQLEETDMCYTLVRHTGLFNMYNKKEFLPQLSMWKKFGCHTLACNFFERDIKGKTVYIVIITPPDHLENSVFAACPLATAHGILVSGLTYIFPRKDDADMVQHYLLKKS